ncbi:hypothetical protein T439DRAFT_383079 [Meredithblackwellia eburnea MCA 4105]
MHLSPSPHAVREHLIVHRKTVAGDVGAEVTMSFVSEFGSSSIQGNLSLPCPQPHNVRVFFEISGFANSWSRDKGVLVAKPDVSVEQDGKEIAHLSQFVTDDIGHTVAVQETYCIKGGHKMKVNDLRFCVNLNFEDNESGTLAIAAVWGDSDPVQEPEDWTKISLYTFMEGYMDDCLSAQSRGNSRVQFHGPVKSDGRLKTGTNGIKPSGIRKSSKNTKLVKKDGLKAERLQEALKALSVHSPPSDLASLGTLSFHPRARGFARTQVWLSQS